MPNTIKLKKGLDIRLSGKAQKILAGEVHPGLYGVKPVDFPGLVPKLSVRPDDTVLAGSALFFNKMMPEIRFTSPVSGVVKNIVRGERRRLLEIVIEKKGNDYVSFGKADPDSLNRDKITERLLESGLWPVIRQRPYHIVANPHTRPKAIFITCMDSAPLAPDYSFIMENISGDLFRTGIRALSKLTDGKIHLIPDGRAETPDFITQQPGVEVTCFIGPHPAGNVGVHIHHIDPVNKGEFVWFVNLQDVVTIGRLFAEGIYKPEKIIALTGSEVINPQYYRVLSGGSIAPLVTGNVKPGDLRYISGNVLTGSKIENDGYIGFYDSQITVIPEGKYFEFFGWAKPGINKFSFSRTFLSSVFRRKEYREDTNYHGGERAFVVTGQYEKVVPMDIYPMQLLKAIIAGDIEMMENLGIYEIAEEDFALCEYICPSKTEIQSIVRKGIELMIKEMS